MAEKLTGGLEMLGGEEKITQLGGLQLTTRRLAYALKLVRRRETGVAMIEDIDSARIRTGRPSIAWTIIGGILIIIGFGMASQYYTRMYSWIPVLIGAVLVAIFFLLFLLRKRMVQFTIAGMEWLSLSTRRLGSEQEIADFVNKFFELKDKAYKR